MSTHVSVSLAGIVVVLLVASIVCNCVKPNGGVAAGAAASYKDCVGQWVRVRYGAEDIEHVAEGKLLNVDEQESASGPLGHHLHPIHQGVRRPRPAPGASGPPRGNGENRAVKTRVCVTCSFFVVALFVASLVGSLLQESAVGSASDHGTAYKRFTGKRVRVTYGLHGETVKTGKLLFEDPDKIVLYDNTTLFKKHIKRIEPVGDGE